MRESTKLFTPKKLAIMGLLIAMEIILSRFLSISAWNVKIGFAFIAVVAAAVLFGPVEAAIVGGVSDFFGAILFPIGAYFPGFTLTSILMGTVWGSFLKKKVTIPRILLASAINQFGLGLFLNTLWISILYGNSFFVLFPVRAAHALLLFIVQAVTTIALQEILFKRIRGFAGETL